MVDAEIDWQRCIPSQFSSLILRTSHQAAWYSSAVLAVMTVAWCTQAGQAEVFLRRSWPVLGEPLPPTRTPQLQCWRTGNWSNWSACLLSQLTVSHSPVIQGVTTCLYPLTVVKTRQMAMAGSPTGLKARSAPACDKCPC